MRTTRMAKIAMVIFLSMIFFLGVQKPVLAAGKNTTVKIPVEQIFEANNSVDADKTGSYVLIADQIQKSNAGGKQWKNIYLEYEWQFFYRADYECRTGRRISLQAVQATEN